jgi:hypothetical protein
MCARFSPLILTLLPALAAPSATASPWPAEPWSSAINLTPVEGPGVNDFHADLSGAFWNPRTRRLWLCRNGPANSTSKLWCLAESPAAPGFIVDTRPGPGALSAGRAEWTGFNDAEALTQADLSSDTVFVLAEGEEVIRQYTLAVGGVVQLVRTFNTRPHLPVSGGQGAEAIAFIPDGHLQHAGFLSPAGLPALSQRGLGGLFFVGHQNGGRLYVFDLSASDASFSFLGSFPTASTEVKDLFFDRSASQLYILHGNQTIQVVSPASAPSVPERRLITIDTFSPPPATPASANIEGLAISDASDRLLSPARTRSLFLTIDDGGSTSLLHFRSWPAPCRVDINLNASVNIDDLFIYLNLWFAADPRADFNFSGAITLDDLFIYLNAWFAGC